MSNPVLENLVAEETKNLPDTCLQEVLDFILFLKKKQSVSSANHPNPFYGISAGDTQHLQEEFLNYNSIFPR